MCFQRGLKVLNDNRADLTVLTDNSADLKILTDNRKDSVVRSKKKSNACTRNTQLQKTGCFMQADIIMIIHLLSRLFGEKRRKVAGTNNHRAKRDQPIPQSEESSVNKQFIQHRSLAKCTAPQEQTKQFIRYSLSGKSGPFLGPKKPTTPSESERGKDLNNKYHA